MKIKAKEISSSRTPIKICRYARSRKESSIFDRLSFIVTSWRKLDRVIVKKLIINKMSFFIFLIHEFHVKLKG